MHPIYRERIRRIVLVVSTLPLSPQERMHSVAIVTMGLKLAGERDPELLLQEVSRIMREIIRSRCVCLGILDQDGQTIRVYCSGMDAGAIPSGAVLRPGLLATMLADGQALRLRNVSRESL